MKTFLSKHRLFKRNWKYKKNGYPNILLWRRHTAALSSAMFPIATSPSSFLPNHTIPFGPGAHVTLSYSFSISKAFPAKLVFYFHSTPRSIPPTHPVSSFPTATALQNSHSRSRHSHGLWSCCSATRTAPGSSGPWCHQLLAPAATLSLPSAVPLAFSFPQLPPSNTSTDQWLSKSYQMNQMRWGVEFTQHLVFSAVPC